MSKIEWSDLGNDGVCVDTLHMSPKQRQAILQLLDQQAKADSGPDLRGHPRVPYSKALKFLVEMHHPGGTVVTYLVEACNISQSGAGFLHGSYVHENSACQLMLPMLDGKWTKIAGTAVRCRWVAGKVHQVGVKFDEPIEVAQFIENAPPPVEDHDAGSGHEPDKDAKASAAPAPDEKQNSTDSTSRADNQAPDSATTPTDEADSSSASAA